MKHLSIDIETYSDVDIRNAGLYNYAESDEFEILLFAYSVDFGDVKIVDLVKGECIPEEILQALKDNGVLKHAYNAPFEIACLNSAGYETDSKAWECTMFRALYFGYPAGLKAVGEAMDMGEDKKKSATGNALIKLFCLPCKPTAKNGQRTRNLPDHEPEKWELFKDYCVQDVVSEVAIYKRLASFSIPDKEVEAWQTDLNIVSRGVLIDDDLVTGALEISDAQTYALETEAKELTGLENPNSGPQLLGWLNSKGIEVDNVRKATVSELLETVEDGDVKRVLELRQELSKTSLKKYDAMKAVECKDGRARGLLQFYGANKTGRWAGRLVQVQNLPRNYIEPLGLARDMVVERKADLIRFVFGNVSDTVSQLIRTAFIPSPGNKLIICDYSAIEARVIAWLAGEQWRQEVFKTHGKIYEASASQMFGVPIEKIVRGNPEYELRQKGKVAELALGYQGSTGALKAMGALNMGIEEAELKDIVDRWRDTNKRIVDLWQMVESAALETVGSGQSFSAKGIVFSIESCPVYGDRYLTLLLPSGRKLYYPEPSLTANQWGHPAIEYKGLNQVTRKWESIQTYGGKLTENIVQAIARDVLSEAIVRLEKAGYKIVMHIHDEVVIDAPPEQKLADVEVIMCEPLEWAEGLLLNADGFESEYYMKD